MCRTTPKSKNSRNSGKNCATKTKINDYSSRSHGCSLGSGLVTPRCYSLPVVVPAATEGSGAGGIGAAGTAAEIPLPREDVTAGTAVVAAGTAAEIPRRGKMLPQEPRRDYPRRVKMLPQPPKSPLLQMKTWEECPPHAELLTPPVSRRENPRRVTMSPLPTK